MIFGLDVLIKPFFRAHSYVINDPGLNRYQFLQQIPVGMSWSAKLQPRILSVLSTKVHSRSLGIVDVIQL